MSLLPLALVALASAQDPTSTLDTSAAESLGLIADEDMRKLRPLRRRLPANPEAASDFSAYTLEWGEVRLGLASLSVGVLPRTQLGTVPALNALGIYNAQGKFNFIEAGPLNIALQASTYQLPIGDFHAHQSGVGGTASLKLHRAWSVHAGARYDWLGASGMPDLTALPPAIAWLSGDPDLSQTQADLERSGASAEAKGRALTVKAATDIRFNRRDSLVLQGSAMMWGEVDAGIEQDLPPILGLDDALRSGEQVSAADSYVASAAWQFSWKRADLRVGGGISSVPGAWLVQSTDFAWRFGGETRRDERHLRTAWKRNARLIDRLAKEEAAAPKPPASGVK